VSTGSRFYFALARPEDDPELRTRMAEGVMEGDVAITFRREPSYFDGARVYGDRSQVIKCVDAATHRLVGLGCRSTLSAYVDGVARRVGYLSDLRSMPEVRGGTLLARGFRYLRQLHETDPVPFYFCVMYEGNTLAAQSLVGGRAGLPSFRDFGRVLTPAVHLDFPRKTLRLAGVTVVRAKQQQLPAIVRFLNEWQRHEQLAPVYRESDFGAGRFAGLRAEDFLLALRGKEIVGTIAAWDQHSFRQTHVERYSRRLALVRPAYNLASRFTPLKALPGVGGRIPFLYFSCMCAHEHNTEILRLLLRSMYNSTRSGRWHYAIVGLHESDPYATLLQEYRRIEAAGRLFVVYYPGEPEVAAAVERLKSGRTYVEVGCI
jgi:hypothetical protein